MGNNKYTLLIIGLIGGIFIGFVISRFTEPHTRPSDNLRMESSANHQKWTCSMHPQIIRSEAGNCPICGMDLIPVETYSEGLTKDQIRMSPNAMALANIQTTIVSTATVSVNGIKLSGKIKENEEAKAVQASYFSGRIEKLNIRFSGDKVNKGQALATVYSPELVSAQQELITALSIKESQQALYKAVRNKLKLWKLTDNQINAIESSGKVKENFPLYATVSGTVSEILVREGDYVKKGQALFKIADLSTVWASFDAYENHISRLKTGQKISITTNAYTNRVFDAKITFINPVLNSANRTVQVRAVLRNTDQIFKPGMFIEGKIELNNNSSTISISIPESAVLWTGERSLVYIRIRADEAIFESREIVIGNLNNGSYTVLSGLNKGDEIVTNGTFTVDAVAQLQGKKSMMNKKGSKTTTRYE